MPRVLFVTLLLLLAGATPALSGSNGSPDPKRIVLQGSDLPSGFVRQEGKYRSNAEVASEGFQSLAKLRRWGRVNGFDVSYNAGRSSAPSPLGGVTADVAVYRTAAGASAAFNDSPLAEFSVDAGPGTQTRISLGTPLGDDARLFSYTYKSQGIRVREYLAVWRTENLLGAVVTAGSSKLRPGSAVGLARLQQRRMAGAARS